MNKKLRIGINRKGELFPWLGVVTPTVPQAVGDILIVAMDGAKALIRATPYSEWANKIVCEWRDQPTESQR